MMLYLVLSILFISVKDVACGQGLSTESVNTTDIQSCRNIGHSVKKAHVGWPFRMTCKDDLTNEVVREIVTKKNISCSIKYSNGTELWSSIFPTFRKLRSKTRASYPRLHIAESMNATFNIEIKVQGTNICSTHDVTVLSEVVNKENYSCRSLPTSYDDLVSVNLGRARKFLLCEVGNSNGVKLYNDLSQYTYEWWYNCSKTLPENVAVDKQKNNMLDINNVKFSNGGEYVCAVRHNNQTRFLFRYLVCVTREGAASTSVECPERVSGKEGSTINITCHINEGIGSRGLTPATITWLNSTKSQDTRICMGRKRKTTYVDEILDNEEVRCENVQESLALLQASRKCFRYQPPPDMDTPPTVRYNVTLQIKNLQQWDVGQYSVEHSVLSFFSKEFISRNIEVVLDRSEKLKDNSVSIGTGCAVAALYILLIIICCWKKDDILWFNKKYFGPYEKEKKAYDVLMVYHYSRDDMSPGSKLQTEKLIENLYSYLEEVGMKVYDEYKEENDLQHQIQNLAGVQDDCHRILIILNDEIAFDEWNLHKVYSTINSSVQGGANLIFIPLPGMRKKFRDAPEKSQVALKHAMKVGTTIDWSGKIPFQSKFKRSLEYVLPKKKRNQNEEAQPLPARLLPDTAL